MTAASSYTAVALPPASAFISGGVMLATAIGLFFLVAVGLHRRHLKNTRSATSSSAADSESISEQTLGIAGFAAGLIGLVFTGIWIPYQISIDSNSRQDRATCFNSVLSLRKTINELSVNYIVAPQQLDQRMADWDALGTELENTSFGCQNVNLAGLATTADLEKIRADFPAAKTNSEHLEPDRGYLRRVSNWSSAALESLQAR
jgi:hypothetical protein